MDSILSITVRDSIHPCAPYQASGHNFYGQIFHCDGTPLRWKGMNYSLFLMQVPGPGGGRIHAQVRVPPGCYLIRAIAPCKNVVTDWTWVGLGCNQTLCVNLVPPTVRHCIQRALLGLLVGTVDPPQRGDEPVAKIMPREVEEAVSVLKRIIEKLPADPKLPTPPTAEELPRLMREADKEHPHKEAE